MTNSRAVTISEKQTEDVRDRPLRRLLRSAVFKFTLIYLSLFMLAVALLGVFVYDATLRRALDQVDQELVDELASFERVYQSRGILALRTRILGRMRYGDNSIYMLVSLPSNKALVSNIEKIPEEALGTDGIFEFAYSKPNFANFDELIEYTAAGRVARFQKSRDNFGQGAIVMVARDINDLKSLRQSARNTIIKVAIGTVLLGLLLGVLTSRALLSRVDMFNRTASAIRGGDLSRRIQLTGAGDEFDDLAVNLNAMLDQIERLMAGMRQVSDNIAHDLRSPLARIRNNIADALEAQPEAREAALEKTADEVERLLATFNALLSITRIESGEGAGALKKVDLQEVVGEVTELYEPAAEEAGFALEVEVGKTEPILGSRELISQALANMLDNAFKYARSPDNEGAQKIVVTLSPRQMGGATLSVTDNGPGVRLADREKIVKRFVRLEASRTSQGSGLGLSMVNAISRAHHAPLVVDDGLPSADGQGQGLALKILFPPMPKGEAVTD